MLVAIASLVVASLVTIGIAIFDRSRDTNDGVVTAEQVRIHSGEWIKKG